MVEGTINISNQKDKILETIKTQQGFQNKSQAIEFVINIYEEDFLEPELKPEYIKKLKRIQKENNFITFNSIEELRNTIEND